MNVAATGFGRGGGNLLKTPLGAAAQHHAPEENSLGPQCSFCQSDSLLEN